MRHFAAKKRGGRKKKSDGGLSANETEGEELTSSEAAEPESAPVVPPTSGNFFSVGDIKVLNSTPDHKPPS